MEKPSGLYCQNRRELSYKRIQHNFHEHWLYQSNSPVYKCRGFWTVNEFVRDVETENISSIELGYTYSTGRIALNVNGYYTYWQNRPTDNPSRVFLPDQGVTVTANLNDINAIHQGIEFSGNYLINKYLSVDAFASYSDWRWNSAKRVNFFDEQGRAIYAVGPNNQPTDSLVAVDFDAKGVSVGDAPQT